MKEFKRISAADAKNILKSKKSVLVDIREAVDFEASHEVAAIHLSTSNIESFIHNTPQDTAIIVICYHGNGSQNVAHYLSQKGFAEVYSVDGGYAAW